MAWFDSDARRVDKLIARKQYDKAERLLDDELAKDPSNTHVRQRLADVCLKSGKEQRAIELLDGLVEGYAAEGFMAKAVATLKKIQRIDPSMIGLDERLERLSETARGDRGSSAAIPLVRDHLPEEMATDSPGRRPPKKESSKKPTLQTSISLQLSENWLQEAEAQQSIDASPLLNALSRKELFAVAGNARLVVKHVGALLFSHGEPSDSMFMVASGYLRVYEKGPDERFHQAQVLQTGDVIGEEAVLSSEPRGATVTAAGECELLELDRPTFESIVSEHPGILEQLLKINRGRLAG